MTHDDQSSVTELPTRSVRELHNLINTDNNVDTNTEGEFSAYHELEIRRDETADRTAAALERIATVLEHESLQRAQQAAVQILAPDETPARLIESLDNLNRQIGDLVTTARNMASRR